MQKYFFISLIALTACSTNEEGLNQFSDEKLITIYTLQDQRNSEALLPFLKAKKLNHRVAANLAFASIQDTLAIPYLNQTLQIDQDELPRRAAAYALGQIRHPKALAILRPAFDAEFSKINQRYILEAIGKCGNDETTSLFEKVSYTDSTLAIGWAYGTFRLSLKGHTTPQLTERMFELLENGNIEEQNVANHYFFRLARRDSAILEQYKSISSINLNVIEMQETLKPKNEERRWSFEDLWYKEYTPQTNPYAKSKLINAIDISSPKLIPFLIEEYLDTTNHYIVRNTAYELLLNEISEEKKWMHVLNGINSGDMALQSLACYKIHQLKPKYPPTFSTYKPQLLAACQKAQARLTLPLQSEPYIDLGKAIEVLGGTPYEKYIPEFTKPIDWEYVKTIKQGQQIKINTNKGDIVLETFVNDAPGTVANILQLIDSGFYNNKFFHRVVPQFVIQGGCPRGDGWGGLNWNQRSEFSNYQTYSEGTAGVASAGKDTEGVQFFITHCPAPHLDGRYSIFARVVEGMDVANTIEVGDKIREITQLK